MTRSFSGKSFPAGTTADDIKALDAFLAKASDARPVDYPRALRFLRSRSLDVQEALKLWQGDQRWRQDEAIDGIIDEAGPPPKIDALLDKLYEPIILPGRSRSGQVVMYRQVGTIDVEKLRTVPDAKLRHLIRRHVREMERLRLTMESDTVGVGPLGGHLTVLDLANTSLPKFLNGRQFWQEVGGIDQNHFGEMLGCMLLINPPPLTKFAIDTVKAFIDPTTAEKIVVRSGDPRSFMHEYVDAEHLPEHLRPKDSPPSPPGLARTRSEGSKPKASPLRSFPRPPSLGRFESEGSKPRSALPSFPRPPSLGRFRSAAPAERV